LRHLFCGQHKACSKVNHRVVIKLRAKAWPRCPTVDPKHPVAALRGQHRAEPLGRRSGRLAGPKKAATPTEHPGRPPGGFQPLAWTRLDHGNRSWNPFPTLDQARNTHNPWKTASPVDPQAMAQPGRHPGRLNGGESGFRGCSLISYFQLFNLVAVVEGPVFCGQGRFFLARQRLDDRTSVCKPPRCPNPETGTSGGFSLFLWVTHGLL
jgi:hypothetical protein